MTDSQRTAFYIPKWLDIQSALGWRMVGGRLAVDLAAQSADTAWSTLALDVIAAVTAGAQRLAAAERRAVTADDLRKGCNWLASGGRTDSSRKFSRTDFNHFDRLRNVLCRQRGHDLAATMAWLNPKEDDRKRSLEYLRKVANEGRLVAICRNAWGHDDVDGLDQGQLDWLLHEVRAYPKYPRRLAGQPF